MADDTKSDDHLSLTQNAAVIKMLQKHGVNVPTAEVVLWSDYVIKINRRDKEQKRVLLITSKACYNLSPNNMGKVKRRIPIDAVYSLTHSTISDEFVIHVADEYDYRYKSNKVKRICEVLKKAYSKLFKEKKQNGVSTENQPEKMSVVAINQQDLKDMALTKAMAQLQTREDYLKRMRQKMAESRSDSDNEEMDEESKDSVTQLLEGTEKVRMEDFELLKVLGRGSFGKVMQVRHKRTGGVFAMKILKKRAIVARNQVEHTRAERKILESLQHPFLMTLRWAFQTKDKLYFVLDYFQGGELFFHLKNKRRFSEEVARLFVGEIALALGHLHSLGIIYRDLKPENILLDEAGHVCLTDFGLSKDVDPEDKAHTFCGTPEYLAPEIVTGKGHGKAVDWWSLGILLYELTVGIPPFYSQNVNEMYNKIQHGVLRFPPFLKDDCKSLIIGLLNRDPASRLGSKNDVDDIKQHSFFKGLDWGKLYRKEIVSPYRPDVKQGKLDTSNFDETFTREVVVDSVVPDSHLSQTLQRANDAFNGFTFQPEPTKLGNDDGDSDEG